MKTKTFLITYDFFNYAKGINGWDSASVVIQHRSDSHAKSLFWENIEGHLNDPVSASTVSVTGVDELNEDDEPSVTWCY
ncbi:MAG: hypothetical protein [Bacteriophage sp.]|nr:MAG: hypothetical protein [Bacteriophage sp.]